MKIERAVNLLTRCFSNYILVACYRNSVNGERTCLRTMCVYINARENSEAMQHSRRSATIRSLVIFMAGSRRCSRDEPIISLKFNVKTRSLPVTKGVYTGGHTISLAPDENHCVCYRMQRLPLGEGRENRGTRRENPSSASPDNSRHVEDHTNVRPTRYIHGKAGYH